MLQKRCVGDGHGNRSAERVQLVEELHPRGGVDSRQGNERDRAGNIPGVCMPGVQEGDSLMYILIFVGGFIPGMVAGAVIALLAAAVGKNDKRE